MRAIKAAKQWKTSKPGLVSLVFVYLFLKIIVLLDVKFLLGRFVLFDHYILIYFSLIVLFN